MTGLNIAYLLNIFVAARDATANGTYAIVPAEAPEVTALVKAKYIKTNKRLHNADGNVGAVIVEGATEADLRVDFEIPDFGAAPEAPVAAPAVDDTVPVDTLPAVDDTVPAVPPAPSFGDVPATPFPAAPEAPLVAPATAEAPVAAPVQEEFQAMNTVQNAPVADDSAASPVAGTEVHETAPVVEEGDVKLIGASERQVVTVAQTRAGEVEIEVGVPFQVKLTKAEQRKQNAGLEHHPYNTIAEFKAANPTQIPSFHVAGKKLKDMSSGVKRANKRYEDQGSDITFRAQRVGADDPKGEGVRVYAMFTSEAPAIRRAKKGEEQDAE